MTVEEPILNRLFEASVVFTLITVVVAMVIVIVIRALQMDSIEHYAEDFAAGIFESRAS